LADCQLCLAAASRATESAVISPSGSGSHDFPFPVCPNDTGSVAELTGAVDYSRLSVFIYTFPVKNVFPVLLANSFVLLTDVLF